VIGALGGGFLTQYNLPYYCFTISAVWPLLMAITASMMDKKLEDD
jgi:hypothetical protein